MSNRWYKEKHGLDDECDHESSIVGERWVRRSGHIPLLSKGQTCSVINDTSFSTRTGIHLTRLMIFLVSPSGLGLDNAIWYRLFPRLRPHSFNQHLITGLFNGSL